MISKKTILKIINMQIYFIKHTNFTTMNSLLSYNDIIIMIYFY